MSKSSEIGQLKSIVIANRSSLGFYRAYLEAMLEIITDAVMDNTHDNKTDLVNKGKAMMLKELIETIRNSEGE